MNATPEQLTSDIEDGSSHRTVAISYAAIIVLVLGLAVRFQFGSDHGLRPEQEYRTALLARAFFVSASSDAPAWEKDVAKLIVARESFVTPPVVEAIAAVIYVAFDNESLWLARALSSLFWIAGGLFLFLILQRLATTRAALAITVYYTFLPTAILLGRSFQPDSLMILLVLAAVYAIIRREDSQSQHGLIVAAMLMGASILIRPAVAFVFLSLELILWIRRIGVLRMIASPSFWLSFGIAIAPVAIYATVCAIWIEPGFVQQLSESINPSRLITLDYWPGWARAATQSVGAGALLFTLIGFYLLRNKMARSLVAGFALGYLLIGLVTGGEMDLVGGYHLLFIVVVSISSSALIDSIATELRAISPIWKYRVIGVASLVAFATLGILQARETIDSMTLESSGIAHIIGEQVGHSAQVAFIAEENAVPLMYYSRTAGEPWPEKPRVVPGDPHAAGVLKSFADRNFKPEFLVVTDFEQYRRGHDDLRAYVEMFGRPVSTTKDYLIYRIPGLDFMSSSRLTASR